MADNLEIDDDDRPVTSQVGRGRPSMRKKWTRRILTVGIALGALFGFVAIVFNAYDRGKQPADDKAAPVIKAEEGPLKVRPQQPGGMDVPNQDKQVYGRIAPADRPPQVEHLIPPPEANVARPPAPPQQTAASQPAESAPAPAEPKPAEVAAPATPPAPPAAEPEPAQPVAKEEAPPEPAPPPKAEPPARTASVPRAVPPPTRVSAGGYRVQIASLKSEDAAKRTWTDLSKRHADLFGKLSSSVVRADLGQKGVYYRLQAGPLADAAAAQALCNRAKQRKLGCIVVKP